MITTHTVAFIIAWLWCVEGSTKHASNRTSSAPKLGLNICQMPSPDPCYPGGRWDPLLSRCHGVADANCYQCYTGEYCQQKVEMSDCLLQSLAGNPMVLAEYWTNGTSAAVPCLQTPADYRPAYQFTTLPPVEEIIKRLHAAVNNAETDGYTIVYGVGATNVLFTAVSVLSQTIIQDCTSSGRTDCPSTVDVFVQTPFYNGYIYLTDAIYTANWNPQADASSEFTIEIVTHPNNPDGELRRPKLQNASHVIHDMAYYWPMYTDTGAKMNEEIMVFTATKHAGLAATRFGWGLIKDAQVAKKMTSLNSAIMINLSEDSMLRVYNSVDSILSEKPSPTGMLPYHEFGRNKIFTAIKDVAGAIADCKGLGIEILNDYTVSPGAYAWLRCTDKVNCAATLQEMAKIQGIPGSLFGSTDEYLRLTMFVPSVEMMILIEKLSILCKNSGKEI